MTSDEKCQTCHGSGIEPGSINAADDGNDCYACRGMGRVDFEKAKREANNLEISGELDSLAFRMRHVGARMELHPNDEVKTHGIEMLGASEIARDWAKRMRNLK